MSKKNKSRELTVEDRFELMFGNNDTEEDTSEKDWFYNKRDFAEQIAKSFGVSEPDDIEEPTSILKPSSIDDMDEKAESNDTAEDVISMLGIKSSKDVEPKKAEKEHADINKEEPTAHETAHVEYVATSDRTETPTIELWLNEKSHVLHFSDGIRRIDMPLDIMDADDGVTTKGVPSEEDFERLYERLVISSVPTAVLSEVAFRMQYMFTYTFYKGMPFRFMYVERNDSKFVFAYVLERNYQYNLMKTYTSLKEINRLSSAYRILSLFTDTGLLFGRNMLISISVFVDDDDCVNRFRNELSIYDRCEEMLVDALKSDPVASGEPSENDMRHIDELDGSIFIHAEWNDLLSDQFDRHSIMSDIGVPETVLYDKNDGEDDDDNSWNVLDEPEDEKEPDESNEEEEDVPTLAPKDEEERRSIMEAFGQSSDDESDEDDEDLDDSDEEEEEDIAKFLKDDDDKDDGDDIMIDVKR